MTDSELQPPPDVSWLKLDAAWYAEIQPGGFGYWIHLTNGGLEELHQPWAITRRGAERKGRRLARRRNKTTKSWRVD